MSESHPHMQPVNNPNVPSRSSYQMLQGDRTFAELELLPGATFVDLGCGPGDYTIRAAEATGANGRVFAVDRNAEALATLRTKKAQLGLENITILEQDLCDPLPIDGNSADVALICTVLHHPAMRSRSAGLFANVRNLLKPEGRLVVVEMHKKEMPFGPPLHIRIAPDELEPQVRAQGLQRTGYIDLGYVYLMRFSPV